MQHSNLENTWDHRSHAHLGLGLADLQITRKLQGEKIKTILLVDTDLIVDVGYPERQRSRFEPLFSDLRESERRPFAAAVARFFYFALFATKTRDVNTFGDSWAVAPSHFGEVVGRTTALLDECDTNAPTKLEDDKPDLEAIRVLLDRLKENPWADIDSALSETLSSLGVFGQSSSSATAAAALVQWVKKHRKNAIGYLGENVLEGSAWPSFNDPKEVKLYAYWRGLLRDFGESRQAIDNDARVLAALSILNKNWRRLGRRVILITGSTYLLRAVNTRHLDPFRPDLVDASSEYGAMMSDFIRIPSCVVASSQLWNPVDDPKSSGLADLFDFPLDEPAVEARRMCFSAVCHRLHNRILSFSGSDISQLSETVFAAISALQPKFAANLALQQLVNDYTRQVQESALAVKVNLDNLLSEPMSIEDTISARGRIDILESLIFSVHMNTMHTPSPRSVNRLRSPPFVDLTGESYVNLRDLLSKLSEATDADDPRLDELKKSIYQADRSTYLLVLVYATHYAHQGRWALASTAAQYAYQLSQTKRYTEASRYEAVFGEEAALLDLACRRRGASDVIDIEKALREITNYEQRLHGENEILTKERLRTERSSLCLTSVMIRFFLDPKLQDVNHLQGVTKEFRQEVLALLIGTVDLLDEFLARKSMLSVGEFFDLSPAEADLYDRLSANVCNLGWLLFARTPASIATSHFTGVLPSKVEKTEYAHLFHKIEFCAKSLKAKTGDQLTDAGQFNWLSWVMCSLMLGLNLDESPNELAARSIGGLRHLTANKYEHPYDNNRVAYSLEFAEKFHG